MMTVGPSGGLDLESFAYAKYIIVWGMNMISTNLHAWPFILEAQTKGAKIVVITPCVRAPPRMPTGMSRSSPARTLRSRWA